MDTDRSWLAAGPVRQWTSIDATAPSSSASALTRQPSIVAAIVGGCSTVVSTTAPAAEPSLPVTVTLVRSWPSGAPDCTLVASSTTSPDTSFPDAGAIVSHVAPVDARHSTGFPDPLRNSSAPADVRTTG